MSMNPYIPEQSVRDDPNQDTHDGSDVAIWTD
jgi:hypothetical protein